MITTEEIKKLAQLARIEVTDIEATNYVHDFEAILSYIDQLSKVNLSEVESVFLQKNIMRQDENLIPQEKCSLVMLTNAPESQDGFYKVPKIL